MPLLAVLAAGKPAAAERHRRCARGRRGGTCRLPEGEADDASSPLWQREAGTAAAALLRRHLSTQACRCSKFPPPTTPISTAASSSARTCARASPCIRASSSGARSRRACSSPMSSILGSLNDGTWPQAADPGPWLNRPMRAGARPAGAGGAHRRRGARLHVAARRRARLSHARRRRSTACRPCPRAGCMRLQALLAGLGLAIACARQQPWLGWARARNRIGPPHAHRAAPEPRPAARAASAPDQRHAHRDVARQSLRHLRRSASCGSRRCRRSAREPDAALRGQIVHEALSRFAQRFPDTPAGRHPRELMRIAAARAGRLAGSPRVAAFWAAALRTLRRLVCRDRAGAARRRTQTLCRGRTAPSCWQVPPDRSR